MKLSDVKKLEGQWAAISLFLDATHGRELDDTGRPTAFDLTSTVPAFVAFSVDPEGANRTRVVPWGGDLDRLMQHVYAYVGAGSHRFYPRPLSDARSRQSVALIGASFGAPSIGPAGSDRCDRCRPRDHGQDVGGGSADCPP